MLRRTFAAPGAASLAAAGRHPPAAWIDQVWCELDQVLAALRWLGDHGDTGRATYLAHGTLRFWSDRSRRAAGVAQPAGEDGSLRRGLASALRVDFALAATLCDACREVARCARGRHVAGVSRAGGMAAARQPRRPRLAEVAGPPLTPREREVAALVAQGLTNGEIAARLVIARRTATTHVVHILDKLGFRSRAQVAAWVARQLA
jgi:DNA-binding CsgD family transcriptional regulator